MVNLGSYYCTYDWYDFEDIQPVFYRARSEVLLGDFPLQGEFIAKYKGKSWYILLVHCTIWTGLVCIPLAIFRQPHFEVNPARWPLVISCLILTHAAMDTFKCGNLVGDDGWWDRFLLYLDQTFHLLQITFLWWVVK